MSLWVPPASRYADNRLAQQAAIDRQGRTDELCARFNREAHGVDPDLRMRFFGDESSGIAGVIPGRYHLTRRSPDAPSTVIAITGPNNEFVEPVFSAIFDKLAQGDMWNSRSTLMRKRAEEAAERARDRAKKREEEERREEVRERWAAVSRAQVSLHRPSYGYAQNHAGIRRSPRR